MIAKKVGKTYYQNKKFKSFAYNQVDYDEDGWADVNKFLPADHDLVTVKVEGDKQPFAAWISGTEWDGIRLRKRDKIIAWKERPQDKVLL